MDYVDFLDFVTQRAKEVAEISNRHALQRLRPLHDKPWSGQQDGWSTARYNPGSALCVSEALVPGGRRIRDAERVRMRPVSARVRSNATSVVAHNSLPFSQKAWAQVGCGKPSSEDLPLSRPRPQSARPDFCRGYGSERLRNVNANDQDRGTGRTSARAVMPPTLRSSPYMESRLGRRILVDKPRDTATTRRHARQAQVLCDGEDHAGRSHPTKSLV